MLNIDILHDEALQEVLEKFISSVLPHENYKPEYYTDILLNVTRYIKLEEMSMEYFVLFSVLIELNKLKTSVKSYVPYLSLETLESTLQNNIVNLVRRPEVRISSWLDEEGMPNNLDIETTLATATQKLYVRTIELYNRCFELQQSADMVLSLIASLKSAFIGNISQSVIQAQAEIINGTKRIGRKVYSGPLDWLEYTKYIAIEIKARVNDAKDETVSVNSLEASEGMLDGLKELFHPLAKYGIEPLDNGTPMLKHRLVILAANENVGKTTVAINLTVNMLRAGRKVVFMCGETAKGLIYAKILSQYINQEYGFYITEQHIANKESCPEDKLRYINMASVNLFEKGLLLLRSSFSYDNLYEELRDAYEQHKFDGVFIDHSLALVGSGTEYERIEKLAIQSREFKKDYPVYMMVLSHLSVLAKEAVLKGKVVASSPTRGNALLSNEADDIFVLTTNETLEKQQLLALQNYKRRNAPKIEQLIFLKKKFNVCGFEYDERYQNASSAVDLQAEEAIKKVAQTYDNDDDDDEDNEYIDM